jgi:hypothetical protein
MNKLKIDNDAFMRFMKEYQESGMDYDVELKLSEISNRVFIITRKISNRKEKIEKIFNYPK